MGIAMASPIRTIKPARTEAGIEPSASPSEVSGLDGESVSPTTPRWTFPPAFESDAGRGDRPAGVVADAGDLEHVFVPGRRGGECGSGGDRGERRYDRERQSGLPSGRANHRRQKIVKASAGIAGRIAGQAPAIGAAAAIVAIALDSGGYGGVALGIGTVAVWIAILVAALGPGETRSFSRSHAVAAASLAVLAILGAFSLGWSIDRAAGFEDVVRYGAYLGAFVLAGLLLRPGSGRSALAGIAAGLAIVSVVALGSRLLGVGGGDETLVASIPASAGRLSYPIGYWNALGAFAAMAVPLLVWLASTARGRTAAAVALAAVPPVVLAAYMTSSRGALIAAVLGAAVVIAASGSRARALAALVVGLLASVPAVAAATLGNGILDAPLTTPGRAEYVVTAAVVAGIALAALAGPAFVDRGSAIRTGALRMRHVLIAALVVVVAAIVLVGPGEIAGDFAATSGKEATAGGAQLSVSGSGRAQFWGTALDAFADEPLRGIGSGSFALYWNQHGTLETPVQNAHSQPLEVLAELGLLGLAAFVAFFTAVAVAGIATARRRDEGGAAAGAALGLVATGLVGILIDWTWDVPAVALPVLVASAVVTNRALEPDVAVEPAGTHVARRVTVPAPAFALLAVAFAVPAIWAGGVLAAATDRLDASADSLAAGDLGGAAAAARSAAAIEPWSAEPWLRLATIEQAAGNLDAAGGAARRAIDLTPADFRPWYLASVVAGGLGDEKSGAVYAFRAVSLAPLVLARAAIEPDRGVGSGS